MLRKTLWRVMLVLTMLSIMVPFAQAAPAPQDLPPERPAPPAERLEEIEKTQEVVLEEAMEKIDPMLREQAEKGGKELVNLYVSVVAGTDMSKYLSEMIVRPAIFGGTQSIYGKTTASNLLKIAQVPGVVALVQVGEMLEKPYDPESEDAPNHQDPNVLAARLDYLRANEVTYAEAQAMAGDVGASGWFDVLDGHKSSDAWAKGFTGEGVIVGVLDDGIDFAHPDLQGTMARVTDPGSPYYGWPMAFSQVSTQYFAEEVLYQNQGARGITLGWNGSRWTDAQTTFEAHSGFEGGTATVLYMPLGSGVAHEYTIPTTSQSNFYKMGSHPEKNLLALYGERVAVLVVDEGRAGVYDTVYVDLDNDYDFTDEKPVTKASPEVYRDMDGDGYADISGGAVVWISNGNNTPPVVDWLWGINCGDEVGTLKACPDPGELVLFTGPFDAGYTHGTQCASNIAGQGVVDSGLSAPAFSERAGGMVFGGAPNVGLMDFGNHYYSGTDEDEYLVAALGYDGISNSGDEIQITSNSYGSFRQMWGGWGYFGRLITALNMTIAPSTVWVFSSGNEGPGYGPQEGDGGPTTVMAGSSTQYGSTNWDSIFSADQIMYGDPNSFFAHGPNRDGSSGLDVLGNGGRGAGDEGLNYFGFNGAESWDTWGGTSRSGPVVAGNLALVYQAYKDRYGVWPTWDVAKALLKSGATNSVSSPFYQGAGVVNADRATDLAAGIYGVYATPDEWQVGDWEGADYLNFANVAYPGDTFTQTFMVNNPSSYNITADLSDGVMTLITKTETTFTTSDESEESGFNFHAPDYLLQLDDSIIPPDAEVMIVRYVHPYSSYDPNYDYTTANSSWRFMLYNWTDQNGDGNLWVDADGNGTVGHVDDVAAGPDNDGFYTVDYTAAGTEIQQGEYVRVDYEFGGLGVPIIVHSPLQRMADGYFFGFQHRNNDHTVDKTTFQIGVEFYKRADWAWLSLSDSSLAVPAEGTATFDAVMAIPTTAVPGAYEGVIFMSDPGDANHGAHETALPVVLNVIADLPDDGAVTLGGGEMADTMYQNSWTHGYFNWYGGGWTGAGDWRHYFLNVDAADLANDNLLIHTSWAITPTDINTWVLGPTYDCASNGTGPCAWFQPGTGQPNPLVFGPYTLQPIASSGELRSTATYPFDTSTGGPDDWMLAPVGMAGLHEIALHNVVYAGEDLAEQFQVDVGTLTMDVSMDPATGVATVGSIDAVAYTETGEIEVAFTPSIELPDLNAALAGGLATNRFGPYSAWVIDAGGTYDAWDANNTFVPFDVTQPGATRLLVHLNTPTAQDPDLFLIRDNNCNGVAEAGTDSQVGSSGNSTGAAEEIVLTNPPLGCYLTAIHGYDIEPNSGVSMDWYYEVTYPGGLPEYYDVITDTTVTVGQDEKFDYTTASFSMTVAMDERASSLSVTTWDPNYADRVDADVYVTNEAGDVVAKSQTMDTSSEMLVLMPEDGAYRFEPGSKYTIWVHGFNKPGTIIFPDSPVNLLVEKGVLKLWLSATDPDVHVSALEAGEPATVTLHFDAPGWMPGEPDLSARFLVGPSVLPNAFDELVTIVRDDPPGPPEWSGDVDISITADSARGVSPYSWWNLGGLPISTALVGPGEIVTYTVRVTNLDTLDAPAVYVDAWPLPWDYLCTYFGECTNQWDGVNYGLITGTLGTADYGGGIEWSGPIPAGESIEFSYWVEMDAAMPSNTNHTTGVDVYAGSSFMDPWIGWDLAGAWYRPFEHGFYGQKMSSAYMVLPGETFTYTIALQNYSAVDDYAYVVDTLPDEVTFVSVEAPATYNAGTVKWTGLLESMEEVEFDIVVTANSDLDHGTIIANEATVSRKQDSTPFQYLYNDVRVDMPTSLTVDKIVDKLGGVGGDLLTYQIVMHNGGAQAATNASMRDVIPAYITVLPDTIGVDLGAGTTVKLPAGSWDEASGVLKWEGTLAAGATYTITFQATIDADAPAEWAIINPARLTADNAAFRFDSVLTEVFGNFFVYLPIVMKN